ncbi:hypothetical protein KTI63_03100 [Acinetobacter guillouiae]|uniref:hypothetical protein n=1 Tax=Acinetobacter guillouiae TaxID=106649 RepID=UPI0021D39FB0|nr:hypothetical protein [Acinetobacter guillouiae]MCU4491452.1 hypothetical protein [Acinetobacter guillouiae]
MKKWFDVNSDYLSAFATLVAAAVALHLYTDWRKPFFLNKVEDEQNEIKRSIRLFKRSADSILLFLSRKKPLQSDLNNGDQFSLEYQEIMTKLLSITDDLFNLLDNYKLIFNENIHNDHIEFINRNSESLEKIYYVIAKFDPVINYQLSYNLVYAELQKEEYGLHLRRVIVEFPDGLTTFYKNISQ